MTVSPHAGKRDGKQGEVSSSRAARSAQRHRRATPAAQQIKQGTSAIAAQQPPSTQQAVQQQEEAQVKAQAAPRGGFHMRAVAFVLII